MSGGSEELVDGRRHIGRHGLEVVNDGFLEGHELVVLDPARLDGLDFGGRGSGRDEVGEVFGERDGGGNGGAEEEAMAAKTEGSCESIWKSERGGGKERLTLEDQPSKKGDDCSRNPFSRSRCCRSRGYPTEVE